MIFMNGGIGWVVVVRHREAALEVERLPNDEHRNVRLAVRGDEQFFVEPPGPTLVVRPPGRFVIRRGDDRLILYVTRKKTGVRFGWRATGPFEIQRRKVRSADGAAAFINGHTGGRLHDLRVYFEGHVLVFEGTCSSYYTKQLAQEAAHQLATTIRNGLVVIKEPGDGRIPPPDQSREEPP